jgi:hypothetical protein
MGGWASPPARTTGTPLLALDARMMDPGDGEPEQVRALADQEFGHGGQQQGSRRRTSKTETAIESVFRAIAQLGERLLCKQVG